MWPKSACLNETKTNIKVEAMGAVDATLLSGGGWWLEDCRILDRVLALRTKSGVPGATGELYTTGLTAVLPSWPGLPCVLLLSCYNYIKQYQQQIDRYPPHSDHCHAHVFFLSFFQVIKNFVCITNVLRRCTFKDSFRWLAVHLMKSVFNTKSS